MYDGERLESEIKIRNVLGNEKFNLTKSFKVCVFKHALA